MRRVFTVAILCCAVLTSLHGVAAQIGGEPSSILVAWTGDADRADSDFLAVIDATPGSTQYGRVIGTVPVRERSTNPHHTEHVFTRGHALFAIGFGGNRIFRFDLSNPTRPQLIGPVDSVARLAFAHSMERLPSGNVLATMQAASPDFEGQGGLAEFNEQGKVVRWASAVSAEVTEAPLRPYSLAVVPSKDRIVTASSRMGLPEWHPRSDGFEHEHTGFHIQLWRLSDLSLLRTITLKAPKGQESNLSPYEPGVLEDGETVLVATSRCGLYRVGSLDQQFSADLVYQFKGRGCAVPVRLGRFWIQGVRSLHQIVVLDISDPSRPIEVSHVQFDDRQGLHWLSFDARTNRVVAVNDPRDDPRIWMLQFDSSTGHLQLDESFREPGSGKAGVSFDRMDWPHGRTEPAIPHGTVFVR